MADEEEVRRVRREAGQRVRLAYIRGLGDAPPAPAEDPRLKAIRSAVQEAVRRETYPLVQALRRLPRQ